MKLNRLVIHNIKTIADATIDFNSPLLGNEPLFLITGETGAGKSTILDCICLALFNDIPRTGDTGGNNTKYDYKLADGRSNQISIDDLHNMMRLNATECSIVLTFDDDNGVTYTATWSTQRAYKKAAGNLQDIKWNLASDKGFASDKRSRIKSKIKELLGVDVKQFYRSVMLPQGRFADFLLSKTDEKSRLLESLTGTEIYSKIGQKIYKITSDKQLACDQQSKVIEGTTLLKPEDIAGIQGEIANLQDRNALMSKQNQEAAAAINWNVNLAQIEHDLAKQQAYKDEIDKKAAAPEFLRQEQLVRDWNAASDARKWYRDKAEALDNMKKQSDAFPKFTQRYQVLRGGITHAQASIEKNKQDLADNQHAIDEIVDKIKTLTAEREAIEAQTLKVDIDALNSDNTRLLAQSKATSNAKNAVDRYTELKADCQKKQATLDDSVAALAQCKRDEAALTAARAEKQKERDQATKDYEDRQLLVDDLAQELRRQVKLGQICPVCGHKIDQILDDGHMQSLVAPFKEKKELREQELAQIKGDLIGAQNKVKNQEKIVNNAKNDLAETAKKLEASKDRSIELCQKVGVNFTAEHIDTAVFDQQEATIKRQQLAINEQLKGYQALVSKKSKKQQAIDQSQETLNKLNKNLVALRSLLQNEETEVSHAQATQEKLLARVDRWAGVEASAARAVDNLSEQFSSLLTDVEKHYSYIEQQQAVATRCQSALDTYCAEHDTSLERIALLASYASTTVEQLNSNVNAVHKNQSNAATLVQDTSRRLADHKAGKPKLCDKSAEEISKIKDETTAAIDASNQRIGTLRGMIDADEQARAKHEKDIEKLNALQAEKSKWENMCKMLGDSEGKNFRKIAQSFILGDLLNKANHYLRMFTSRFKLECQPGSLVILVRDVMQGDTQLPATNLSGGESFMAALALALALAQINGGKQALDTIFIDEGFGSLSGEPLNLVIETLQNLHHTLHRRVGIISHVESLKERITAQIQVNRDPGDNTRSLVKVVSI